MAAAIGLRIDYAADDLRRLAKASRDAKQTRRLLALAAIYDGGSRTDAARIGGVGLQVVRDWVRMGYRSLSARPQAHGQDPEAMDAFKKASRKRDCQEFRVRPGGEHHQAMARVKRSPKRTAN